MPLPGIPSMMVAKRGSATAFYRLLTLDQPASDLTSFPVLFSGTYTYLKTVSNGGKVQNSNGYDIIFYSDSALTTKLDFERVSWDGTTGTAEFWIRIPTLTSASATVIYLAYGNTSITTDQQNRTAVWDTNYKAVWHMQDSSSPASDSTSNALNAAQNGTVTFGATGQIGKATSYNNNTSNYLGVTSSIFELTTAVSVECWVNFASTGNHGILDKTIGGNTNKQYQLQGDSTVIRWRTTKAGLTQTIPANGNYSINTWYHVVGTWDGSTMLLYVNGTQQTATLSVASPIDTGSGETRIGTLGTSVFPMDGQIDELRVSSIARNADWAATSYSNQNDPANFYVIGSETPA